MDQQHRHAMLMQPSAEERARQMWVKDFRTHLGSHVAPGNQPIYETHVKPALEAELGRAVASPADVRLGMLKNDYYQFWSACQRVSQEMIWDSTLDVLEHDLPRLIDQAEAFNAPGRNQKGSLRLNPDMPIPAYHEAADIHLQPGGYHSDFTNGDVAAGALYDRGIYIYLMGALGPKNDDMGHMLMAYLEKNHAGFRPQRILDMGCAIGNSTLPWAEAFPEAEVHAIDIGAPVLRYGHARAEAMGVSVHFAQANAEHTDYPAESFDLITSHIMLHETGTSATANIFRECLRLLKPGGRMMHLELPRMSDPFTGFMMEWEAHNNNENFGPISRAMDWVAVAESVGWAKGSVRMDQASLAFKPSQKHYVQNVASWPVFYGEKR